MRKALKGEQTKMNNLKLIEKLKKVATDHKTLYVMGVLWCAFNREKCNPVSDQPQLQ